MSLDPDDLYHRLGQLAADIPDLNLPGPIPYDTNVWLANAVALVEASGASSADVIIMKAAVNNLSGALRDVNAQAIVATLLTTLTKAELAASPEIQGRYIAAESPHSAFVAVGKVLRLAKKDVLIIDAYADALALSDFAIQADECVNIRLLTDAQKKKVDLDPAIKRWRIQYPNVRALAVRLAPANLLHDRLILVDGKEVWSVGQSLNGIAKRSPTAILKIPAATASEKVAAYESIWATSNQI